MKNTTNTRVVALPGEVQRVTIVAKRSELIREDKYRKGTLAKGETRPVLTGECAVNLGGNLGLLSNENLTAKVGTRIPMVKEWTTKKGVQFEVALEVTRG